MPVFKGLNSDALLLALERPSSPYSSSLRLYSSMLSNGLKPPKSPRSPNSESGCVRSTLLVSNNADVAVLPSALFFDDCFTGALSFVLDISCVCFPLRGCFSSSSSSSSVSSGSGSNVISANTRELLLCCEVVATAAVERPFRVTNALP